MQIRRLLGGREECGVEGESWSEVCRVHIFPDSVGGLFPTLLASPEVTSGLPGSPSSHGSWGGGWGGPGRTRNESQEGQGQAEMFLGQAFYLLIQE